MQAGQYGGKRRAPAMPKDLASEVAAVWRRIVPQIAKLGRLEAVDRDALADMCRCLARLEACERDIATRGLLVPGERGLVKNPACQLAREYRAAFAKWSQRFGLTPSDRDRIDKPPEPEQVNPILELLKRPVAVDTEAEQEWQSNT